MSPQNQERLTPRQQRFFTCVFLVIGLTFTTFIWLIAANGQEQRERLFALNPPHTQLNGPVQSFDTPLVSDNRNTRYIQAGKKGAARFVESRTVTASNVDWILASQHGRGFYTSSHPKGWQIIFGQIQVPENAPADNYTVTYFTPDDNGDTYTQYTYRFQVTSTNKTRFASPSHLSRKVSQNLNRDLT